MRWKRIVNDVSEKIICFAYFSTGRRNARRLQGNKQRILRTLIMQSKAEFLYQSSLNQEAYEITNYTTYLKRR